MFKVEVESLAAYFAFDPVRRADLERLDNLIKRATGMEPYFHAGTPAGQPGMRFKMIGYGLTVSDRGVEWPTLGVALQKNYISVYMPAALLDPFRGQMRELRMGQGNFSFVRFADLDAGVVSKMLEGVAGQVSARGHF